MDAQETELIVGEEAKTYELWDADQNCEHTIRVLFSGYKCTKCGGWYCA